MQRIKIGDTLARHLDLCHFLFFQTTITTVDYCYCIIYDDTCGTRPKIIPVVYCWCQRRCSVICFRLWVNPDGRRVKSQDGILAVPVDGKSFSYSGTWYLYYR